MWLAGYLSSGSILDKFVDRSLNRRSSIVSRDCSLSGMAGHNDDASSKKKAADIDLPTINLENLQSNMKTIYYSRTFLSIIGGVIAGIMGFTSSTGFLFYLLVMAFTSLALIVKANFNVHSYFDGWNRVLFDGFLSGLMSFVLFWTFAYDIVHIF